VAATKTAEVILTDGTNSRKLELAGGAGGATFQAADIRSALISGTGGGGITVTDTTFAANLEVSQEGATGVVLSRKAAGAFSGTLKLTTDVDNGAAPVAAEQTATFYNEGANANTSGQATDLYDKVVALGTAITASETGGETDGERVAVTNAFKDVQSAADTYVIRLGTQRSFLGAYQNQMEYTLANITELSSNLSSARSRVIDTDYASETAALTRGQILQQAATAMLAQANQMPNVILTLLK